MKQLSIILLLTLMGLLSSGFTTIELNKVNQSVQCSGTTKKGLRCKNRTLNASVMGKFKKRHNGMTQTREPPIFDSS
jgi:hypothetical protein